MTDREKIVTSVEAAKADVAKLGEAINALQREELDVTREIENAPPHESIGARMMRAAVLEATADAAKRLDEARKAVDHREHALQVHDATKECAELAAEYKVLREAVEKELMKLVPQLARMDEIAARRGWLEKAVIRVSGDFTNAYFFRPSGAIAFGRSWIKLDEKRYAELPEGLGD